MNPDTAGGPSPQQLNAALCAYVHTVPNAERLRKFVWSAGLGNHDAEIQKEMHALVKATDAFLWAQTTGIIWNADFEDKQYQHLRERFPWLDAGGFSAVLSYSRWLSWHDGLDAGSLPT